MKRTLLLVSCLVALALPVLSQTTNAPPTASQPSLWNSFEGAISSIGSDMPTNFAVAPYMTYAPGGRDHLGGGVLAIWNVTQNIGMGIGGDYLGGFSMVNATATFKVPTHPLSFLGWTNLTVTPLALAGIAKPIGGTTADTRQVASISGAGGYIDLAQLAGGTLSVGGAWVNWQGSGVNDGGHGEFFLGWRHGF